jgi:glycosyltransferase involved in cell wall biosynthesis
MYLSLVIPSFYPAVVYGGPIFATLEASQALSNENVEVYVSTTNANGTKRLPIKIGKFLKQNESFFIKYYDELFVNRFSLHMLFSLWKDIKKADVVHVQSIFSAPTPIALFYCKIFDKKTLLSPRGSLCKWGLNGKNSFKNIWLKFLINPFIKNINWHATSPEEMQDIKDIYPNAKIKLISDGVDVEKYDSYNKLSPSEYIKKFCKREPESVSKIIVSMGRIHKVKGFDILIKSFYEALKFDENMILLIAGKDDGFKSELKKLRKVLNLKNRVFFVGDLYSENKVDFLSNADLFVLPSHTENFGIVYAESLATGTPIIASTNTPWSIVEEYDCGKWVENNVDETTKAMKEILLKDRETMRINSKKLAQEFDWKNIAKEFKNLFEEMVKEK